METPPSLSGIGRPKSIIRLFVEWPAELQIPMELKGNCGDRDLVQNIECGDSIVNGVLYLPLVLLADNHMGTWMQRLKDSFREMISFYVDPFQLLKTTWAGEFNIAPHGSRFCKSPTSLISGHLNFQGS